MSTEKRLWEAWEANSIAEKGRLAGMIHFPPSTEGRGKRRRDDPEFLDAVCAFLGGDGDHLSQAMGDAFKTGNTAIFQTILDAKNYCDSIPHSGFSRDVMSVLKSKITLRSELDRNPTKKEVCDHAKIEDSPQYRTKVIGAAKLKWLPNDKPCRNSKKHGEHSVAKRGVISRHRW